MVRMRELGYGGAITRGRRRVRRGTLALLLAGVFGLGVPLAANAATWNVGDVFAAVGNGSYNVYDNSGVFKETINQGRTGFTTGCAFNNDLTHLYTTNFSTNEVVRFQDPHPHLVDQFFVTPGLGLPADASAESVVFMANDDYLIGHADGGQDVHRYNPLGILQQEYDVATELGGRGSDWMDLAADQTTLFYTSEGRRIFRYNLAADTQLPDFATVPGVRGPNVLFALRLLPPGDGSGGLLVADRSNIKRLDGSGAVVQTYDVLGEDGWFSLNLDPNGTSFWAGNEPASNRFYRFNIATGAIEVGPVQSGPQLFGLCLKGEPTAATRPPLDHFKCYSGSAAADHAAAGRRVTLSDQFGESTAVIAKVYNLCNPADKNDEGINQEEAHLVEYKLVDRRSVTGRFLKHRVVVDNQFGAMSLLVQRPNRLMVPSSKAIAPEQPGDPPSQLDHFLCYKIHAASPFTNRTVSLEDQFGAGRASIRKPRTLCTPVSKNGEEIQSGDEHLVCYVARELNRPQMRSVIARNQFGVTSIGTHQTRHLCVPSTKRELEN
jgi:hypothetical protein